MSRRNFAHASTSASVDFDVRPSHVAPYGRARSAWRSEARANTPQIALLYAPNVAIGCYIMRLGRADVMVEPEQVGESGRDMLG